MDDDRSDLAIALSAQAGMIMEDMSVIALTIGKDRAKMAGQLKRVEASVGEISALIAAARALVARQD